MAIPRDRCIFQTNDYNEDMQNCGLCDNRLHNIHCVVGQSGLIYCCDSCYISTLENNMKRDGEATLYLAYDRTTNEVSHVVDVTHTMKFEVIRSVERKYRIDLWFTFDNSQWHGCNQGRSSTRVHCKRSKS